MRACATLHFQVQMLQRELYKDHGGLYLYCCGLIAVAEIGLKEHTMKDAGVAFFGSRFMHCIKPF